MPPLPMNTIARDYVTDGVPASGDHDIQKPELREWGTWVEDELAGVDDSLADMQAAVDDTLAEVQVIVDGVASRVSEPEAYQAWWRVKSALAIAIADINILFLGDSTSDSAGELAQELAGNLFVDYPAWTVKYYTFNFGTGAWGSPSTLQVGTGVRTIHVYNASISGGTLDQFTGQHRTAILNGLVWSLVIINHGLNYNSTSNAPARYGYSSEDTVCRIDESMEDIIYTMTDVPILISTPNPSRADWDNARDGRAYRAWHEIAKNRGGMSLVDVRRIYLEANKPTGWYTDDIHPLAGGPGVAAAVAEHKRAFDTSRGMFSPPRLHKVLKRAEYFDAHNQLLNGRFQGTFTSGVPASWTKSGAGSCAEETSDVSWLSNKATRLEDNVLIQQVMSDTILARIRGRTVVVAALMKVDGGDEFNASGMMYMFGGVGGESYNGSIVNAGIKYCWHRHGYPSGNGEYAWKFMQEKIPYNAASSSVFLQLYGSNTESSGRYALWSAVGLFLKDDFEDYEAWF